MKILYINKAYRGMVKGRDLYINLFKYIAKENIVLLVYIQLREDEKLDKTICPAIDNVDFLFLTTHHYLDRFRFFSKIKKGVKSLLDEDVDINSFDHIHAHTMFSDGGVAYELNKLYGIKYSISIRSVDINIFMKYFPNLKKYMYKIIKNSTNIVFLNPSYKNKFIELIPINIRSEILNKSIVIPNGISMFWHENINEPKSIEDKNRIHLLHVGKVDKNKNCLATIKTVILLKENGYNATLDVLGEGPYIGKCKRLSIKLGIDKKVRFHGWIKDLMKIKEFYRNNDIIVLPSFGETFGLVYVEAMSQGVPVIYSKGQGIDGYFKDGEVGYAINPYDNKDIAEKIELIIENYKNISINCINNTKQFDWNKISKKYIDLFKNVIRND